MAANCTSQASSYRPARRSALRTLSRWRPIFISTSASLPAIRATRSSSGRVPMSTVITSSPQVIGVPVAVHAADMPVMAGTTSTGSRPCRRA